ncbi:MAG: EF-hand domain-containing protein [Gammaproteobacteria bacterium]|nr:EF-hand domain-containing protein [Gammaproteobacteria bacterium]
MNIHRHPTLFAAALAVVFAAGVPALHAQQTSAQSPDVFHGADKNNDGRLDKDEYRALTEHPQGATQDEPGKGLPATKHQAEVVKTFKDVDTDHDGYIDADEITGKPKR